MEYSYVFKKNEIVSVNNERIRFWKESKSELAAEQIAILEKENEEINSWTEEYLDAIYNSRFA